MGTLVDNSNFFKYNTGIVQPLAGNAPVPQATPSAGIRPGQPIQSSSMPKGPQAPAMDEEEAKRLLEAYIRAQSQESHHDRAHAAREAVVKPAPSERFVGTTVNQGVQTAKFGPLTPATILLLQGQAAAANPFALYDMPGPQAEKAQSPPGSTAPNRPSISMPYSGAGGMISRPGYR